MRHDAPVGTTPITISTKSQTVNQLTNQSINQSINQTNNQTTHTSIIDKSINYQSTNQLINKLPFSQTLIWPEFQPPSSSSQAPGHSRRRVTRGLGTNWRAAEIQANTQPQSMEQETSSVQTKPLKLELVDAAQ